MPSSIGSSQVIPLARALHGVNSLAAVVWGRATFTHTPHIHRHESGASILPLYPVDARLHLPRGLLLFEAKEVGRARRAPELTTSP